MNVKFIILVRLGESLYWIGPTGKTLVKSQSEAMRFHSIRDAEDHIHVLERFVIDATFKVVGV